jgi:hypothetical protein
MEERRSDLRRQLESLVRKCPPTSRPPLLDSRYLLLTYSPLDRDIEVLHQAIPGG